MASTDATPMVVDREAEPIQFREYKILLKAARFHDDAGFHEFWKVVRRTAKTLGFEAEKLEHSHETRIREVLFFDTPRFDLYNNHFILRKRTLYRHGWLEREQRVALKFRHPSREVATAVDVHPALPTPHRIRFKEELLLERGRVGGMRSIFSHASVLASPAIELTQTFAFLERVFPALATLGIPPAEPVGLVNNLVIEEVFENIGRFHFSDGVTGDATVAIWRDRATQAPLIGEFAFQIEFDRIEHLARRPKELSEAFYKALQFDAHAWIEQANTKTALIYRTGSVPVTNDE